MHHIVLLGDSIFDNGVYVGGDPDVATHLRQLVPADWKVTLCAVDGSSTGDIIQQLKNVPQDASHLFLSVGGNDALAHSHLLTDFATPGIQILEYLADAVEEFGVKYRRAIKAISTLTITACECLSQCSPFTTETSNHLLPKQQERP
ncbi:hypothetical protein ES708_08224 [subsurface metagenome]